jgi:pyruvate ferredoxin oxidoreductase gamma subunit
MFEVRIHGRGGQGVVTAAELLSVAAFDEGRHAQAFPSFGSERTGAPVVAFCRVADQEIRVREPVVTPDALVVQDSTLLHQVDVFAGLKADGYALINSPLTTRANSAWMSWRPDSESAASSPFRRPTSHASTSGDRCPTS